jgi:hypothetical protein
MIATINRDVATGRLMNGSETFMRRGLGCRDAAERFGMTPPSFETVLRTSSG